MIKLFKPLSSTSIQAALCIVVMLSVEILQANTAFAELTTSVEKQNNQENNGEYVRKRFLQLMKKPFINDASVDDVLIDKKYKSELPKRILIIGDSHAQDFLNAVVENGFLKNSQISTRYIPTRCQIVLDKNKLNKWRPKDKQLCEKSDKLELAKTQIKDADVIILAAFWRKWAVEALPQTIQNLRLRKDQRLFVIGRRSFRKAEEDSIKQLSNKQLQQLRTHVDTNQIEINNIMRNTLNKDIFINVHQLICGQGKTCPIFTDDLKMISFDGGHLSKDGARYIGRELFQKSLLSTLTSPPK